MARLFLLRHLKSQWNSENRFAGWVDNPLSKEGILKAQEIAQNLEGEDIKVAYTSPLIRNMETVSRVFENIQEKYPLFIHLDIGKMQKWGNFSDIPSHNIPAYVSQALNERYYGKLQGLNKEEITEKYGKDLVYRWRRGYSDRPPGGESLKDVYKRTTPFFKKYIQKDLVIGKNVLIVASHNSLRAIVKYIESIPDTEISDLEIPFGSLSHYEFDGKKFMKYNN